VHPHADIAYMTRSARKLGGDFIDFIKLTKDRYVCIIGDVSGKGLNASMSMIILKSVIRTYLKETKDFKTLVIKINAFIKQYLPRGTFFAGMIGLFDFSERNLYYINCGVPVMMLLSSAYNNPVEIQGAGKVLGFVKDIAPHINVRKAGFKTGDILLVTTDGLVDAESVRGVRFGKERLQHSLLENRSLSSERIVRFLYNDVNEFVSQEINDDITIVAVKFQ
ncbi:MAG: PP2C family protein-serine/threonine phosphatase, partial [Termitinemataceae bacterium]